MSKLRLFLPVMTALFLTFSLYAANAARLGWGEIIAPLIIGLVVSLVFMGLFSLHPLTRKSMPLIASVFTLATLIWYMITPYAGLVLLVAVIVVGTRKKINTQKIEKALAVGVAGMLIFSACWGIAVNANNRTTAYASSEIKDTGQQPNIYFIVTDRMPSPAAMLESGLDPTKLVQALASRGFYVKVDQTSADPYKATDKDTDAETTRTMRFFASVLNLGKTIPIDITYKECRQLITYPSITDELHDKGYTFYNVASWFAETSKIKADYSYHYEGISLLERLYSGELIETCWGRSIFRGLNLRVLQSDGSTNQIERDRQLWQMVKVKELMPTKSSFIMAHILLPHEPFVWAADGTPETNKTLTTQELYLEQIKFAADYIVQLADNLRRADPTAIIIFQSDEGMAYKKPVELNYDLSPTQWSGVFTAWYIPGANVTELASLQHTEILRYVLER